uniref:Centromere protein P n=1 Tax=Xiphophorus couchianus TaxID=32473 RepID=A0A3B5MDJ2_9TELE
MNMCIIRHHQTLVLACRSWTGVLLMLSNYSTNKRFFTFTDLEISESKQNVFFIFYKKKTKEHLKSKLKVIKQRQNSLSSDERQPGCLWLLWLRDERRHHVTTCCDFRVEETRDLLLFFRTIRSFSEKCDDRTRTFQHFQEKFPSIVSLPKGCGSEVMTLNHPELPGCGFFIHWCLDVSTGGAVTPKIQLLSKIPEKALQMFPSQSAGGGAAEAFQSLLRILGPEAAIESIIRAVSLSERDELSD